MTRGRAGGPDSDEHGSVEHGLVLVGGGGHAVVVAEAARLAGPASGGVTLIVCLDDAENPQASRPPGAVSRMGGLDGAADHIGSGAGESWILALGDLHARRRVLDALLTAGGIGRPRTVIHPDASVSPTATIGAGVYIGPRAVVHARALVGDHAIVNSGAIVEHGASVGVNAHVASGAVLAGDVGVGDDTLIGMGALVLPGVRVGARCVIGAGAVVRADVADGVTAVGVPARGVGAGTRV